MALATLSTLSVVGAICFVTSFTGMLFVAGEKSSNVDSLMEPHEHFAASQSLESDADRHIMSQRALSLSHKYAGLGRRSSNSDFGDAKRHVSSTDMADVLFEDNEVKLDANSRSSAASDTLGKDNAAAGKRALPSGLRYAGLGKRRQGVSAAMRYAGLGKRFPEAAETPETETSVTTAEIGETGDLEQTASATDEADNRDQLLTRRRRFAIDWSDDVTDDEDDNDENTAVIYGIKRQLAAGAQGKPRIGVGMRYVGVGKRNQLNLRSRINTGMRYMGVGKRSPF